MRQLPLLLLLLLISPLTIAQTFVPAGQTTTITNGNSSYYVQGKLIMAAPFNFSYTSGSFFASAQLNPVDLDKNDGWFNPPDEIVAAWGNITGAFKYLVTLTGPGGTQTKTQNPNGMPGNLVHFPGLQPNATYQYYVQAWGGTPNVGYSNVVSISTSLAPHLFPATNITASSFVARWTSIAGTNQYGIFVTGGTHNPGTFHTADTHITISGLSPSTNYTYNVWSDANNLYQSDDGSVTTCQNSVIFSAPTNLTAKLGSTGNLVSCNLTWDIVTNAVSYNIQAVDPSGVLAADFEVPLPYFTFYGYCATQYTFKVAAKFSSCSDYVNYASLVVPNICTLPSGRLGPGAEGGQTITVVESADSPFKEMTAYPNPSANAFTVAMPWTAKEDTPVLLYDTYGSIAFSGYLKKGEWHTEIPTSGLSNGLYIVRAVTGSQIDVTKVMVVH